MSDTIRVKVTNAEAIRWYEEGRTHIVEKRDLEHHPQMSGYFLTPEDDFYREDRNRFIHTQNAEPVQDQMERVYLAMPYSHDSKQIMERRFKAVTRIAGRLAENDKVVFSPITHSHTMAEMSNMPTDWDFWCDQDIPFLQWADKIVVVKAKGWRESTGVNAEIEYMRDELDKPVEYIDPVTHGMKIVGISGKKRSGKDHMADVLVEEHGYEKYSLADPIKESAEAIFGFTEEQLYGGKKEEVDPYWDVSPREVLQEMGTNFFREEFDDKVWMDAMHRRLSFELPEKVVIPDIRFPNEVEGVQEWGGTVFRIDASERLQQDDDHASETALDGYEGFDRVVDNNGSLEAFESKIFGIAGKIERGKL